MTIQTTEPVSWLSYKRLPPRGYSVITDREALDPRNKEVLTSAREFINRNVQADAPIGHQEFKTINGKKYLFVVEPHMHPAGGPVKPWGWHKGATVFTPPVGDLWAFLYHDEPSMGFGFGVDAAVHGSTLGQRLKRYAIPAGITVVALLNPIAGGMLAGGAFAAKHLRKKAAPMPPISPAPEVHDAAPLQV